MRFHTQHNQITNPNTMKIAVVAADRQVIARFEWAAISAAAKSWAGNDEK